MKYDYIVVGAGSAGCVVANRLSANPNHSVLLLEAGTRDSNPLVHMPAGWTQLSYNPKTSWVYYSEPEAAMANRAIHSPRGKMLGGCSSTNGMVYMRGQREDYDRWADLGNDEWGFDKVLPFFKQSECNEIKGLDKAYHGDSGPLHVNQIRYPIPLADTFMAAAEQAGFKPNSDFNGACQEGVGRFHVTQKNGKRHSAAAAFLTPIKSRKNLTVLTQAHASRIMIKQGKAVGVSYLDRKGREHKVLASREVILSLGAYHTPQLLELSGIGDQQRLQALGIPLQVHSPDVGENLQEHLTANVVQKVKNTKTMNDEGKPHRLVGHVFNYLLRKQGLLTLPAAEVGGFLKLQDQQRPDVQLHFAPAGGEVTEKGPVDPEFPCVTASTCVLRPESRGSVHITSKNPVWAPRIQFNFLDTEYDRQLMIEGIRTQRRIFQSRAFDKVNDGELAPGAAVQSDEEILNYIRETAQTVYHPVGTCRMGSDDKAVVDQYLRVKGVQGLRVADASIMPEIISGNTNAPCIMIGERCADFILRGNNS